MKVVLVGELGTHARGKMLVASADAQVRELPPAGIALAFGKEAQRKPEQLVTWAAWAQQPGRVLVLVPPFRRGACATPTAWEALRTEPLAGGESELGRLLASERQHELRGDLVPADRVGGQVITGCWRRHPAAGLFVVTALPLWSLRVLDHPAMLRDWLGQLLDEAGTADVASPTGTAAFEPDPRDWSVLLHLCTGPYANTAAVLQALERSVLFAVPSAEARHAAQRLEAAGWVEGGALTAAGRAALQASPHAVYANALSRMHHA